MASVSTVLNTLGAHGVRDCRVSVRGNHIVHCLKGPLFTSRQRFERIWCRRPINGGRRLTVKVCAETTAEPSTVRVKVQCVSVVEFGESMKIVGGGDSLGNWDLKNAPAMEWGEGDVWTAYLDLLPGSYEFKCVKVRGDGSADWEPGENRNVEVPEIDESGELLEVKCQFWDTANLEASVSMDEDQEVPADVSEVTAEAEEGSCEEAASSDSPNEQEEAASKLEEESSPESMEPGESMEPAEKENAEKENVEKENANGAVTASENRDEELEAAIEGLGGREDEPTEQPMVGEVGTGVATMASSSAPPPHSVIRSETSTEEISVGNGGLGSFASVLGLVSAPIVAWSEYTLKTTGCGLPPGPGGLIGAAEGIGYLVVTGIVGWSLFTRLSGSKPKSLFGIVEGASYLTVIGGLAVLALQVQEYGYIPSALPDDRCPAQPTELTLPDFASLSIPSLRLPEISVAKISVPDVNVPLKEAPSIVTSK